MSTLVRAVTFVRGSVRLAAIAALAVPAAAAASDSTATRGTDDARLVRFHDDAFTGWRMPEYRVRSTSELVVYVTI